MPRGARAWPSRFPMGIFLGENYINYDVDNDDGDDDDDDDDTGGDGDG